MKQSNNAPIVLEELLSDAIALLSTLEKRKLGFLPLLEPRAYKPRKPSQQKIDPNQQTLID